MAVNLFEYMAHLENKVAADQEQKTKDFAQRMEEYERAQAAEHARTQMSLDAAGAMFAAEQAEREAREQAAEQKRAIKRAKAKKYGYRSDE